MSDIVLEVKRLGIGFAGEKGLLRAVEDISFQLRRGETLGIVGESGSGKSVTALAIMGLIPTPPGQITSGEIWLQDGDRSVDLCQLAEADRQRYRGGRVAMVFQEPMSSLNPVYTIGFQLLEAIHRHQSISPAVARAQAIARLQEVKLLPPEETLRQQALDESPDLTESALVTAVDRQQQALLNRYPHELSGGQMQRVMIAMAIASNPDVLIADEPTTALDVTVQATILDLLRELRDRRGMALIFITHDFGIIAEIADQVAVMYQGKIVETAPVLQLFSQPQHPYTRGLLACRPRPDQRLRRLPTVADFLTTATADPGDLQPLTLTAFDLEARRQILVDQGPLLVVENLQVGYPVRDIFNNTRGHFMAVKGVSFQVYQGETFGLVGESGCGKTTLGRALLGLVPVRGGHIWFEGRDMVPLNHRQRRPLRRDMQIIFQDPYSSLDPRMTIGATIAEPLKIHRVHRGRANLRERVAYLLERVGLNPDAMGRYPHQFSGGQRQRICIARALALNPKFIICDESVSALDVSVQAQVLNLLKELQGEFKLTYIFISHDLGVVKFMSDRIMVMNQGQVEEIGPADTIYHQPQRPYTQQLIQAIPLGSLDRIRTLQGQRRVAVAAD